MVYCKKISIIALLGFVLLTTGCGAKVDKKQNKEDTKIVANIHRDVLKSQTVDQFSIKKIALLYESGTSTFTAQITNDSAEEQRILSVVIYAKDKEDKVVAELTGYIGEVIASKETRTITSHTDADLSDIVSISYKINYA